MREKREYLQKFYTQKWIEKTKGKNKNQVNRENQKGFRNERTELGGNRREFFVIADPKLWE